MQTALDTVELRVVLSAPLDEAATEAARGHARLSPGYPFNVVVVPVTEIPRGPTGKFEEFLSLLDTP